jgi:hypothetical protein
MREDALFGNEKTTRMKGVNEFNFVCEVRVEGTRGGQNTKTTSRCSKLVPKTKKANKIYKTLKRSNKKGAATTSERKVSFLKP